MIKNNTRRINKLRWVTILIIGFMLLQTVIIATIRSSGVFKKEQVESESPEKKEVEPHTH